MDQKTAIIGCILGCAVGDAIGLPREGLTAARARRLWGPAPCPQLVGRRTMVSDDTEHLLMTACALLESGGSFEGFEQALARHLRTWLVLLPPAAGLGTLRACFRLLRHVSPERSGVPSAGNGPLMRAPIIGLCMAHDVPHLLRLVRVSTAMTHTDPRAERAAQLVALAVGWQLRTGRAVREVSPEARLAELLEFVPEPEEELAQILARARAPEPLGEFFARGVSGYAYHTLLAVLHTWLHHGHEYAEAVSEVINLGGDTDTTAAVVGALVGATAGPEGIPEPWLRGLREWPRDVRWMTDLAPRLAHLTEGAPGPRLSWQPGATLLRNIFLLLVVLGHGFYRLMRLGGRI